MISLKTRKMVISMDNKKLILSEYVPDETGEVRVDCGDFTINAKGVVFCIDNLDDPKFTCYAVTSEMALKTAKEFVSKNS